MKKSTHILIVEDVAADVDLAQRSIRKVLRDCDFQVVETRKDFLQALETFQPDVILSEYAMPSFDGMTALKLALKHAPLTPLIIWTGSAREDVAVDCMKAGANNYVLKENLKRLGPAILRALEEKALLAASKQAAEALQASEKRFRALIENGLDNISLLSADGTLLWESPSSIRTLNYAPNEHVGRNIFDELMHPEDLQWTRDLFVKLVGEPGSRQHASFRLRHADGTWHWVEAVVTNLLDEPGIHAMVANYRDVNDRKQMEEALRESQIKYQNLVETSHDLIWSVDAEGRFTFVNGAVREIYGYEPEQLLGRSFFEILDREYYQKEDFENFGETIARTNEMRELEIYVQHRDGRKRILSSNSIVLRDEFGKVVGVTGTSHDVTERKRAEEALRASEARFRTFVDHATDAFFLHDEHGLILDANRQACESLGYTHEELIGLHPLKFDADQSSSFIDQLKPRLKAGETVTVDTHHRRKDGTIFPVEVRIKGFPNAGRNLGIALARDITERKQVEERIRDLLAFNEKILNYSSVGILTFKVTGQCVFANEKAASIVGADVTQLLAQNFHAIPAWKESGLYDLAEKAITTQAPVTADIHHISTFGKDTWMTVHCVTFQSNEVDHLLLSISDITERKRAEEALRESESRLILALSGAQMSVWEWDLQTNHILWSPEFFEITGIEEDNFGKTFAAFTDLVHADDVERLMVAAEKAVAEKTLFAEEFRIIRPDGETRWLSNLGHAEYDSTRDHLRLIGTVQDITQRKRAELERQALLEVMLGLANTRDLQDLLHLIHRSIANAVYARNFFVVLYNESSGLFEEIYSIDQYDPPEPPSRLEKSIAAFVFRTGEPLLLTQTSFAKLAAQGEVELVGTDSASWLGVPLKTSGRTIGVMAVQDYEKDNRYSAHDRDFLASIATQVALAIEHRKAGNALKESEERFSSAFEYASIGMALVSPEGHWLRVNWALCELLGYTKEELTQRTFQEITYPDDLEKDLGSVRQVLAGEIDSYHMEKRYIHKLGHVIWVLLSVSLVRDHEGKPLYLISQIQDIMERKQAEEKLQRSEARYRLATQSTKDVIWEWTLEGNKLMWTENAQPVFGYAAEEIGPSGTWWDEHLHPEDRERVLSRLNAWTATEEGKSDWADEYRFRLKDGSYAYVDDHAYLERDSAGRTIRMIGAMSNITERKRAEAAERDQRALAEALLDTAETLNSTLDYGEVLDRILAAVGRVVPHEAAMIMLIDRDVARVVRSKGYEERGHKGDVMTLELSLAETANLQQMLGTGQPVVVSDTHSYPGWKRLETMDWLCSDVGAPISINGEVIGFILLDSATCGFFTAVHAQRLEAFASQAALAIHHARLLQQAQEEIAERKRAEEAVQQSENKATALLNALPDMMFRLDREGTMLDYKAEQSELYAQSELNLIGQKLRDVAPREFADLVDGYTQKTLASGEMQIFEYQLPIAGRGLQDYEARMVTSGNDEVTAIVRNIAERKQAERALLESNAQFRTLFEASPDAIILIDQCEGWPILDCNTAACKMNGYSREELIGQPIDILNLEPSTLEGRAGYLEQIRQAGVFHQESIHRRKDGTVFPVEISTSIITLRGREIILGIDRDITERKRAEQALMESIAQFRSLFEASPEAIMLLDPADNWSILDCNPAGCLMNGYPREELVGQGIDILNLTPGSPEERTGYLEKIREQGILRYETAHRHKNGTSLTVEVSTCLIKFGTRDVILGIDRDITARKQAEELLRAERRKAEKYLEIAGVVLLALDVEGIVTLINQKGCEILGYSAEEIIGKNWIETFLPEPQREEFQQVFHKLISDDIEAATYYENSVLTKSGEERLIAWHNTLLRDDQGMIISMLSSGEDITERKESEIALVKSQSRYRELFDSSPISIWEEDFSLVKKRIDALLESGVTDLREFLSTHPETLRELAALVKIVDANQASRELYHVDRKEDLLTNLLDILDPAYIHHFGDELIGLVGPLKKFSWEGIDVTPAGRQIDVLVNGTIPHGYEGDWSKLIVSIIDITDRKRAEEEIRRRAEETAALLETSQALTNLDLQVTLQAISHSAKNLFAADGCRIFLMEPNGEELRCVLALQENVEAFSNLKVKIGEGVTGAVAASGRGEIVNAMQNDPRSIQVPGTPEEVEAIMFAPLKERDQTIGVLSVRRVGSSRPFQPTDLELLEALASMAASAVSNARLFEEAQRRLMELEALYENGLAVGRLLKPKEIGERVISTIARYLQWHHVTIRLRREESNDLDLVAFSLPDLKEEERAHTEQHFVALVNKVGQGLSGWVIETGEPLRTGNVHAHPQYVNTHAAIQSGLYMPLKVGERVIGVISVESETPDAFTDQDERLLATLGNQVATAFENARLYQEIQRELSERKRTEEALRSSEVHYRQLADSITDILFELDEDLCYTHWNKASELFSGIPAENAIGKSMQGIFGTSEEQSRREEIYRSVLKERQARTFETEVFTKGQKRALEINAYPSARGISVVAKDVTDRKRSEIIMQKRFELMEYSAHHSLSELTQRTVDEVSELTESAIGFFHFVQEDQNRLGMQTWSTNALRLFQVPVSEGVHRGLDQAGVWAEAVRQRRPLIQNDYESLAGKKGLPAGHVPIVREIVIPIIRNEKVMAVMGIGNKPQDYTLHDLEIAGRLADYAWDITERKQMQNALENERNQLAQRVEERTADLSRANSNLARALRVKDEFLANMSHELRTPLNAILGLSESLSEQIAGPLNEKQQKYITTISESGHHLLSLINDILDLAKIEAGQITLDINKMDIHSVCQASLRMIKQLAQKKNQEVLLDIEANLGLMWADERRLKQMIVNLLSNAVKFTPESGRVGLEVRGDQEANKITITVWDNGIGIREADLIRLFQPFVQLDSGLAREATGTGLGLALVAQMARLHGGSVSAVSNPGNGSRFSIILPWEPALAVDTASRLRTTGKFRAIKPDEMNKPTILLVEDTKEVVMMVQDYLELAGYKVVTAQDGLDALVQAKLTRPNLILMDVQMPRMDGLEATRKLRSELDFKYTPIIALTALAMPSDRERCLAAGMDEYISKPINLKALIRIIQGCLFDRPEQKSR